jgi:hypothetical protein
MWVQDAFYEAFSFVVVAILARDLVLYLKDFNAQMGSSACGWEGVLGGFNPPLILGPPQTMACDCSPSTCPITFS